MIPGGLAMMGGGNTGYVGWNTSEAAAGALILTSAGTALASSQDQWKSCRAVLAGKTTGNWYFEIVNEVLAASNGAGIGLASSGYDPGTYLGNSSHSMMVISVGMFRSGAFTGGTAPSSPSGSTAVGTVKQIAVNFDLGRVWVGENNTWLASGDPSAGSNQAANFSVGTTGALFPAIGAYGYMSGGSSTTGRWRIQAAGTGTNYSPPSGFTRWD